MEWSRNQQLALDKAGDWYENGSDQVFHMFGYAGSGKTTLAKHLAELIGGNVMYGAYTGKAAYVLQTKGCIGASTLHSMIYRSRDKSRATLIRLELELDELIKDFIRNEIPETEFKLRSNYNSLLSSIAKEKQTSDQPLFILNDQSEVRNADLIIIDECSMVDGRMGEDLLSFGTPVLVLGDPAQLPPVGGAGYFTENVKPDVMLDEIHRQAAESPIIWMATKVRNGENLAVGKYGECEVLPKGTKLDPERMLAFDQLLVGKNVTRYASNRRMRYLKGIEGDFPVEMDRLVCLRNNSELGVLNGAIFNVIDVEGVMDGKVFMTVESDDMPEPKPIQVSAHQEHFLGKGDEIKWFERKEAEEFDYGYALTVHKSQGSQWKDVCVFDESFCFRSERNRWLYTGLTRASENLTVVKM